jgi:hypothetical protein
MINSMTIAAASTPGWLNIWIASGGIAPCVPVRGGDSQRRHHGREQREEQSANPALTRAFDRRHPAAGAPQIQQHAQQTVDEQSHKDQYRQDLCNRE